MVGLVWRVTVIARGFGVVGLRHQDGKLDADVDVTYMSDGKGRTVTANKLVWAGPRDAAAYLSRRVGRAGRSTGQFSARAARLHQRAASKLAKPRQAGCAASLLPR